MKNLNLMVRTHIATYNLYENNKLPYSRALTRPTGKGSTANGILIISGTIADFLLSYDKDLSQRFALSVNAGANLRTLNNRNIYGETADLLIPMWYNLREYQRAETAPPITRPPSRWAACTARWTLSFNDYLYLGLTGRMDKSSTLPLKNNAYFILLFLERHHLQK